MEKITLPKLGQTMEKATVEKWIVKEGDEIKKGDIVLEITTDKATLEVESFVSGTVRKILAQEGEEKDVNAVIALVGDPDEEIPDLSTLERPETAVPAAPTGAPQPAAPVKGKESAVGKPGRVRATPRARKLAKELGVDLATVNGTGPGERITEDDVKAQARSGAPSKARGTAAPDTHGIVSRKPLSAMRQVIADRLVKSAQEAPHFYLTVEVDMTRAVDLREKLKSEYRVSYNDMIIKACATAIVELPAVNTTWLGDATGTKESIDIGLAVSIDDGLMVPVVRAADAKKLKDIAAETAELVEKTRSNKLTPGEYGNGSITVSNMGMLGIDSFMPVINLGESITLGIGRIAEKPVVAGGEIQIRKMMTVTVSCDHRVVDGALGARFLSRVKELLEDPAAL